MNSADGPTSSNGIIYAKAGDTPNNVARLMVVVTPKSPIQKDDVVTIKIKASTQEPYKKEISCEVSLRVQQVVVNSYSIEDEANKDYAILKLTNAQETGRPITLEFDPSVIRIDSNDESFVNRISGSESTNNKGYVKKYTFTMSKEATKNIKFYKVDKTKDYTYPSGDAESIITVKNN